MNIFYYRWLKAKFFFMLLLYVLVKLPPPAWQSWIHIIHFWFDISAAMWWMSWTVVVWPLTPVASAKLITAHSGESVLLSPDLQETELETGQDFRWTHTHLLVSMKNNGTCHPKNCKLLKNGSLWLSQVQPADSGNYSLQVFSKSGHLQSTKVFQLDVEGESRTEEYHLTHLT